MHTLSVSLFEEMFAVIGHPPEEQKVLSDQLIQAILQTAVTSLVAQLSFSQKEEFTKLMKDGRQQDEIFSWLQKILGEKVVEKHLTGVSYAMTQKYLKEISSSFSEDQKEKIAKLFLVPPV